MKIIKILFLAMSLFVCIELIARIVGVSPAGDLLSADLATYESVPGIWKPGQSFSWREVPSVPHDIKTNSSGYRGEEFATGKAPDEFRVFMVGDSFTFGNNVNETETLPYQLQQQLYQSCENNNFTLVNAGISGTTITGQLEMVRRGLQLKPDVVVLVFTETDIPELADPLWDKITENRVAKSKFPVSVVWPWLHDSATWALVIKTRKKIATRRDHNNSEDTDKAEHSHEELKHIYLQKLNELAALIEEKGSSLVVVTFPGNHTARAEPYIDTTYWAMEEFPKQGIVTVNLLEPLQQALGENTDSAYLLPVDGHPSKIGYKVAASTVARQLIVHPALLGRCRDV